ncbi:MAG: transcription termination/antitermination factor NusG [Caldisericia bacterium]|nr:transcription termination/antitermination factor NusG [Caldisericia bacterium]
MAILQEDNQPQWYLINTYSGKEKHVKTCLLERARSFGIEGRILDIKIPVDYQRKPGKKDPVEEKVYPGYILVRMSLDDQTWYAVRRTPNVLGFVGPEGMPTALSEKEVSIMLNRVTEEEARALLNFSVGDHIKITNGPFQDLTGTVEEIEEETEKAKIKLVMFGREMPVEIDFSFIEKI